jgi:hypothetical protein
MIAGSHGNSISLVCGNQLLTLIERVRTVKFKQRIGDANGVGDIMFGEEIKERFGSKHIRIISNVNLMRKYVQNIFNRHAQIIGLERALVFENRLRRILHSGKCAAQQMISIDYNAESGL